MPSIHNDPHVNAALASGAARRAAILAMPPDERAAFDKDLEERFARSRLAKAAYLSGRRAPRRRRHFADPPKFSRQFTTMATTVLRDPRLSKTSAALLAQICALAGKTGYTDATNQALGTLLDRSRSTIKWCLEELGERGYLMRQIIHTARGSVKCHRLIPTDLAWPYWHPKRQNPHESCGSKNAPHITTSLKEESFEAETNALGVTKKQRKTCQHVDNWRSHGTT